MRECRIVCIYSTSLGTVRTLFFAFTEVETKTTGETAKRTANRDFGDRMNEQTDERSERQEWNQAHRQK